MKSSVVCCLLVFATLLGVASFFMICCRMEYDEDSDLTSEWNFITKNGNQLFDGNKRFRWASFNVPALLMLEDRPSKTLYGYPICELPVENPQYDQNGYGYGFENARSCIIPKNGEQDTIIPTEWTIPTWQEQEDAILAVKGCKGRVIRTYTLGFGPRHHIKGPNEFYEPSFVAMDYALSLARKHKIRLIIPLINNHNGGDQKGLGNFGDYLSLCMFRGLKSSDFYTNPVLKQDFKDIITFVLNRVNTVNGIRYGDDPTILSWQLGNELGGWEENPPPATWSIEIAVHIKKLAPNTLVMDGTLGGLEARNRYPEKVLQSQSIDIFSNHYYYGSSDLSRITRDAAFVSMYKKAFIIGEFGFDYAVAKSIYEAAYRNLKISAAMIWSLRYHARDGGFYTHGEEKGFYSFHVPGFPEGPGFHSDDKFMAKLVRKYGILMQNVNPDQPAPVCPPCKKAQAIVSPLNLTWFGSAWAEKYQVYRRESNGSKETWELLGYAIDNVQYGTTLFSDNSAQKGVEYDYMIQPIGITGIPNIVDPLILGHLKH